MDREFQFNVKTEDGDDAFKGKGKTFTLTVSKDSLTGELTDADKKRWKTFQEVLMLYLR